ncbi:MAG TPA: YggT family protein [Mycobacterium sp.]|nr:YggT family protein [Mycobacterium sp.]HPZ96411.1 YggT family protein [Mycobacterium sp.]HQE14245.1 YggT family protein [Mycobacterium sp.]
MALFFQILGFVLFLFWLLLIARIVVEFIRSFSRDWRPRGVTVVILETIMTVTDPPVKLLRRVIPQLTVGAVRIDFSIMILLLLVYIGWTASWSAAATAGAGAGSLI